MIKAASELETLGYLKFDFDARTAAWASAANAAADEQVQNTLSGNARRHGGTWFVGVNLLPNGPDGAVNNTPLAGPATDLLRKAGLMPAQWDSAQISIVYPGYPQRDSDESEASHRYRRDRAAAHVDGLLPVGAKRRRMLREPHGFVLGIPLTPVAVGTSPMVVWEGSHKTIADALRGVLGHHAPETWKDVDITEAYHAARRACFVECRQVPLTARPGECYLVHRNALHGILPWGSGGHEARRIAYFRPEIPVEDWL